MLGVQIPGMEQVQVELRSRTRGQHRSVGQTGGRVFGGEARNVVRRAHGLLHCCAREVRGVRVAAALPNVDRHAHRFIAVALDVFDLALAHRHRQAHTLRHFGAGIRSTDGFGKRQRVGHELTELVRRIGKTGLCRCSRRGQWHGGKVQSKKLIGGCVAVRLRGKQAANPRGTTRVTSYHNQRIFRFKSSLARVSFLINLLLCFLSALHAHVQPRNACEPRCE